MTREEGNNTVIYFYIKVTFENGLYTVFKVHGDYSNLLSAVIELYEESKQRYELQKLKNVQIVKASEFEPDMIDDNYCSPDRFKISFNNPSTEGIKNEYKGRMFQVKK